MKKKNCNFWLMVALFCGLSLSVTSCKDDDDNEMSEKEKEEQVQQALEQQALDNARLSVLDQLANMGGNTADYSALPTWLMQASTRTRHRTPGPTKSSVQ